MVVQFSVTLTHDVISPGRFVHVDNQSISRTVLRLKTQFVCCVRFFSPARAISTYSHHNSRRRLVSPFRDRGYTVQNN